MMKKILNFVLVATLLMPTLVFALEDKNCVNCTPDKVNKDLNFARVCNDVSDIICKDVKLEERRSCQETDETIFSSATTKEDLYNFAKGCLFSGAVSFVQFFTDFLPKMLVWLYNFFTGDEDTWAKIKGAYESAISMTADLYEVVLDEPGPLFSKLWNKIVDSVGPMVANYDCLKPQLKVERICGFIGGWVLAPMGFAKVLVMGAKETKFIYLHQTISASEKGRLIKALDYAATRPVLTLKQVQELEKIYTKLGYTSGEFELMYSTGALEKIKIAALKPLNTPAGKAQKLELLGPPKAAVVATATASAARLAPVSLNISSDYITITNNTVKGETFVSSGQIVERFIENGAEVAYRVRMLDPNGKRVFELTLTREQLAKLNAKNATNESAKAVEAAILKDGKFKSPQEEFLALQAKEASIVRPQPAPPKVAGVEVKDIDMAEFLKAQRTYENGIDYVPPKASEFVPDPSKIIKSKPSPIPPTPPNPIGPEGKFTNGYVKVMTKNSMGSTAVMPAQIVKTTIEEGVTFYHIRIIDKSKGVMLERKATLRELEVNYRLKDAPEMSKEFKQHAASTGHQGL